MCHVRDMCGAVRARRCIGLVSGVMVNAAWSAGDATVMMGS